MRNEIYLDFCVWDFDDITPADITKRLGIEPTKIYTKEKQISVRSARVSKTNGWRTSSGLGKYDSFEDQMNAMLNIIEPRVELFKPICEKYYCEFACAVYIRYDNGESTPWLHLDKRYHSLLQKLKIEFDLDLYCLPNH